MKYAGKNAMWLAGVLAVPALSLAQFVYWDPTDPTYPANVPTLISQTGFFTSISTKPQGITPEAVKYEPNVSFWTDGAYKERWIILPPDPANPGYRKTIPYDDTTDFFNYPDSTVFVKNYWLEAIEGDTTSRVLWETRFLVKKADTLYHQDWHGFSYQWRSDQSDADLVDINGGVSALFYFTNSQGLRSYKKWKFPSQGQCSECHKVGANQLDSVTLQYARSILAFFPAQLKRPTSAGGDQLTDLFAAGVFTGTPPDSTLGLRFRGLHDPVNPAWTSDQVQDDINIKARSYIATQCSGCHGDRGGRILSYNFDFYRLMTDTSFTIVNHTASSLGLNDTSMDTTYPPGRVQFTQNIAMSGLDTSAGQDWQMELPPFVTDPLMEITPALLYPGYPSVSVFAYKLSSRNPPWRDSAMFHQTLAFIVADTTDTSAAGAAARAAAQAKIDFAFAAPWGSQAWADTLAAHGWTIDSVFAASYQSLGTGGYFSTASYQMPPVAVSFAPDTAALRVLARWIRQGGVPAAIKHAPKQIRRVNAFIRNRTLFIPENWSGKVAMFDIMGRAYPHALKALGGSAYAMPPGARPGIYFFKAGSHTFKASMF